MFSLSIQDVLSHSNPLSLSHYFICTVNLFWSFLELVFCHSPVTLFLLAMFSLFILLFHHEFLYLGFLSSLYLHHPLLHLLFLFFLKTHKSHATFSLLFILLLFHHEFSYLRVSSLFFVSPSPSPPASPSPRGLQITRDILRTGPSRGPSNESRYVSQLCEGG